jgi:hypothetical protein
MESESNSHWAESRLIEVMKMKIYLIQCVLIVNWIQMKSMKVTYTVKSMMSQEFQYHTQFLHVTIGSGIVGIEDC